jgi:hypothetical protein
MKMSNVKNVTLSRVIARVVVQTEYLSDLIEEFWLLIHSAAPSPRLSRRGKEAPLRVNPEQAPAFRPESRRVDFLSSQAYKTPINDTSRSLITGIGQNRPKTEPSSHYQGKMAS